jgi:hypothetical protein
MHKSDRDYQEFFKEELYDGFVSFLIDKYGASKVNDLLGDEPLFTKKGVNYKLKRQLNEFFNINPRIEKKFASNRGKCIQLRNVCGGTLLFPIDSSDDSFMIKTGLRVPEVIPVMENIPRATNKVKASAARMKGQTFKGNWHEKSYLVPRKLTVYFKKGYANSVGKSTLTFWVDSRSEAIDILLNRYKNKVAFADILNTESFEFVKRIIKPKK